MSVSVTDPEILILRGQDFLIDKYLYKIFSNAKVIK